MFLEVSVKHKLILRDGHVFVLNTCSMNMKYLFLSLLLRVEQNSIEFLIQCSDFKTITRHSCCGFHVSAKPLYLSHDFVLQGKHLRVNCRKGMLADKTKCIALEEGQCRSSTAERERGQCYTGLASQCAFLFQLRNVNYLLFHGFF